MNTPALRALIWDVDGTLAETERDGHRVAFNKAFADAGLDWHWDEATYGELLAVTGGKERLLHWWRRVDAATAARADTVQRIARLHARKTEHYVALVGAGRVALRPGVRRLLAQARDQRLALAIATTTTAANVEALLQAAFGRAEAAGFGVIGAGDVVAAKKPAPDIYRWVLERLGLAPQDCMAIEDSAAGVAAARGADLPVLLTRGLYTRSEAVGPVLADLDGLGDTDGPARGVVEGRPWQGVVDVATLQRWHRRQVERAPA